MIADVQTFQVSRSLLAAFAVLAQARGAHGMEVAAYLAGRHMDNHTFRIDTLAIPDQEGDPVESGCNLQVPGSEFTRLGDLLRAQGRHYCGQIHSHPEEAFHSFADDANPTMRFSGALSIVVPHFGAYGALPAICTIFRYMGRRPAWKELSSRKLARVLTVDDSSEVQILAR